MNKTMFNKLKKIKNEALLDYALGYLLDPEYTEKELEAIDKFGYIPLDNTGGTEPFGGFEKEYTELILDLSQITKETFEQLVSLCAEKDMDLEDYLDEKQFQVLPFELFHPLTKSPVFEDLLDVDRVTGEITSQPEPDYITLTAQRLFEQLEQLIQFRLNSAEQDD